MPRFKTSLIAFSASVLLPFLSPPAHATQYVANGPLEATSPTAKGFFAINGVSNATGWSSGDFTFLSFPRTADDDTYLVVYSPFPATSPDGGNCVGADGDPSCSGLITQTINGLTPGQNYTFNAQAASAT